jgi:putative oxidoreductase
VYSFGVEAFERGDNTMKKLIFGLHGKVLAITGKLEPMGPLLLRIVVGLVFVQTGWGKLNDLFTVTTYFKSLGIPFPELQAPFIASLEFVGGIALLLGFGTRYFAALLSGTMVVAILTAKIKWHATEDTPKTDFLDIFNFDETAYLAMFLCLALIGAGKWSVDQLIKTKVYDKGTAPN